MPDVSLSIGGRRAVTLIALLFLPLLILSALLGAVPATADDGSITWSVRPAASDGADGRSWIELELDPGESAVEYAEITNFSDEIVTFGLASADGYITPTGRFNMLAGDEPSTGAGTWITADASTVTLGPRESAVARLEIRVPLEATPGDHAAGFAASVFSTGSDESGAAVGVESRVGFRVMVRVTGELQPALRALAVEARYDLSWNPFSPGSVVADVVLANEGNTRLDAEIVAEAAGQRSDLAAEPAELFPGTERAVSAVVDSVWPWGIVFLDVSVRAESIDAAGAPASVVTQTAQVVVWAVPWPQFAVLAGIALLVTAFLVGRRRDRRKREQEIADARDAATREYRAQMLLEDSR